MCRYNHMCTGTFEVWENKVKIAFDKISILLEYILHQAYIMHSVIAFYTLVSTLAAGVG